MVESGFKMNWGVSGIGIHGNYKGRKGFILDVYPTEFSMMTEKMVKKKGIPLEPYHRYRETINKVPVVRNLFAQGRRYLKYERDIPLDEFRVLVAATDRLVRDLNEQENNQK
jgi:hypothetical protein